ncbi:MAG: ureidoglycolate lyase [Cyanobacteriota bacterium]|nr:ureidoglycolate lyase [Cyanobacteriota bacterium]
MTTAQKSVVNIPVVDATHENVKPYGQLFGDDVAKPGLGIPFYAGRVLEGENIDFVYHGQAVIRTAKILPGYPPLLWLERHLRMTQLFVGLGSEPFIMVMAPPNHEQGKNQPDLDQVMALRFPPGHALLIHQGTWHDFPIACERPVVIMTANSDEVVTALAEMGTAAEMDQGDVFKISLRQRLGTEIHLEV